MTALHERHHYLCSSPTYHSAAELCFLMAHMLLGCGECQERPFHSKIRVCSAPPWKATPVTLSCITAGKEPNRTSHTVIIPHCLWTLSPFTDWHLPSGTCNFSGNSPSASCNALEVIFLKSKQTEKEILQFSATPYTGHFFFTQQQLCYIKQWELQGQLINFLSVLPVYCTVPSWCSCISTFSYSTEFLMKK